jgi:RHS repeat-associated protein
MSASMRTLASRRARVLGLMPCVLLCTGIVLRGQTSGPAAPAGESPGTRQANPPGTTITLLKDGQRLFIGGTTAEGPPHARVWITEPDGTVRPIAAGLGQARAWHSATVLPDGRVAIIGGIGVDARPLAAVEIFDPATQQVAPEEWPDLLPRAFHTATLLPDGRLAIAGGRSAHGETLSMLDMWEPTRREWLGSAPLGRARGGHTAELLPDGRLRITGGGDGQGQTVDVEELFDPIAKRSMDLSGDEQQRASLAAPGLTSSMPSDGAAGVSPLARVALVFGRPTLTESIGEATHVLTGPFGPVDVKIVSAEGGRLVFLTPHVPLLPDTDYTLEVAGVKNAASGRVLPPHRVRFRTARDGSASDDWADQIAQTEDPSRWQSLPPLQAPPGVTALAGQILQVSGRPLRGVEVSLEDRKAQTDGTGRFLLRDVPAGHHELVVDGRKPGRGVGNHGVYEIGVPIEAGKTTTLTYTIWLTPLDLAHEVVLPSPTTQETVVTSPRLPGLEFRVPAGTVITDHEGRVTTRVSITPIPINRPPFPLPRNVVVPIYFTVQPGGGYIAVRRYGPRHGGRLIYPNSFNFRPGSRMEFWNYDPERPQGWYVYGAGTVTPDGHQVAPDQGVEFYEMTGAMVASPAFAPYSYPTPGDVPKTDGDPVDLETGYFIYEKTDLVLKDVTPVELRRTYRPGDYQSRAFGIGTTHPYDIFLTSYDVGIGGTYSYVWIVLQDGARVYCPRTSPGTSFQSAVFECQTGHTKFLGSRIYYDGGIWKMAFKDGGLWTFPDSEFAIRAQQAAVTQMVDRYGNVVVLSRSSDGRLQGITTKNGRQIGFAYDANLRITAALDNLGRQVSYVYDASGRLVEVTDVNGGLTTFTYNEYNEMLSIRDPRGITYLTNYYGNGSKVLKQVQADGSTFTFEYETLAGGGRRTDVIDTRGNRRRVTFNANGFVESDTRALGTAEEQTTTYAWHPTSRLLTRLTNPLGQHTDYTYNTKGSVETVTAMAGTGAAATTTNAYTTINHAHGGQSSRLASQQDPLLHATSFTYHPSGALKTIQEALGQVTTFGYTSAGQLASVQLPVPEPPLTMEYQDGSIVKVTRSAGDVTEVFNDRAGRAVAVTNALSELTRIELNALNLPATLTGPDGGEVRSTYDANGNLTSVTDENDHVTSYTYDVMDRLQSITDPLGRVETFTYDAAGNVVQSVDRRGVVLRATYDALNRRISSTYTNAGATLPARSVTFTYDRRNRMTSATDSVSGAITWTYDDVARTTTETSALGTLTRTFDAAGRQASLAVSGQPLIEYTYDNGDRLTTITQGTNTITVGYDDAGRRTSLVLPNGIDVAYTYAAGRLTGQTWHRGATTLGTLTYAYDALGRPTEVGGSWARVLLPPAMSSASYDIGDRLTGWDSTLLNSNAAGELTLDGATAYEWDGWGRLINVTGPSSASFQYDAIGRRIEATRNGVTTKFLYDGIQAIQERAANGALQASMVTGYLDEIFTRSDAGGLQGFLSDQLGSTLALTDGVGTVGRSYTYEPFGRSQSSGSGSDTPYRFTGREEDLPNLYYYRARYYAPGRQRFLSEDPFPGWANDPVSRHNYQYAHNRPTAARDPLGLWTFGIDLTGTMGVGAAGVLSFGFHVASNGDFGFVASGGFLGIAGGSAGVMGGPKWSPDGRCLADLEGWGVTGGASAQVVGADYSRASSNIDGKTINSYSIAVGPKPSVNPMFPLPFIEGHTGASYSKMFFKENLFDWLEESRDILTNPVLTKRKPPANCRQ